MVARVLLEYPPPTIELLFVIAQIFFIPLKNLTNKFTIFYESADFLTRQVTSFMLSYNLYERNRRDFLYIDINYVESYPRSFARFYGGTFLR